MLGLGAVTGPGAQEGARPGARFFSCIDAQGKRITSDKPIPQCLARAQELRGANGTVRGVLPPSLTAEERRVVEARERAEEEALQARQEQARRDRTLMMRYPNEAAHQAAQEAALRTVQNALEGYERRIKALEAERAKLANEAAFYAGKSSPAKLSQEMESLETSILAQQSSRQGLLAERERIQDLFNQEWLRLKRLWAGATPGSLGPEVAPTSKPAQAPAPAPAP
jgi:hypothetical protein